MIIFLFRVSESKANPGGLSMMISMCGECLRIGLWHDLARNILNENALDCGAPNDSGNGTIALLHEITENSHGEGGGADVEVLVKGLACHAEVISVLEVACDLVERRQPGGHGAK